MYRKHFPYLGLNTRSKVEGIGRTSSRHDVNPAQGRNGPADQIYGRSENQGSSDSDAAVDLVLPGMGSNCVTVMYIVLSVTHVLGAVTGTTKPKVDCGNCSSEVPYLKVTGIKFLFKRTSQSPTTGILCMNLVSAERDI